MPIVKSIVKLKHFTTIENISNEEILTLLDRAHEFKAGASWEPRKKQIFTSNLFFENSTRTHNSFIIAERKLGLEVLEFDAVGSSLSKGETLYDTILTLDALGVDVCVIRHSQDQYYDELIQSPNLHLAIVNGGDGSGQHPSQCLLDLMTIQEEFGTFEGLKILIVGDIDHSRVARSNAQMLTRLGAKVYFSGPEEWYSEEEFSEFGPHMQIDNLLGEMDVVMLLRVQHERHTEDEGFIKENYHQTFGLTLERAKRMKSGAIIMHPAPVNRDVELADQLVEGSQSRIVKQMQNGVYARMAILEAVL
ncbi:aspartate carbamoyltransferase catalytic subunit [Lactovum miscens]|uniref:Aspartate carbamoyltransferase n=1 Tax=Lactovum miscens TaxID=190387 RepID=A0A841C8G5_9LACT|nr:aspartate carbamoyltransferase catalytic subunit [Lactovum miscens]MBB5887520.1 aspartate carbamoyltransferase catalytic subunit [Lactovum miscens]